MITNITVLGAGTMGHGIAHVFSRHGYKVKIYEPFDMVRENAFLKIREELCFMVDEGYISPENMEVAVDNIEIFDNLENAAVDADYVIEVCPEKLELKQKMMLQLNDICGSETIFSTNTSGLRLSDIIAVLPEYRQKKTMVTHWYNPAYLIPIAELSKFGNMSESDFNKVYNLYVECGKRPIRILKDIPGMVANRLLHAQAREAFHLLEIGAATAEDIDKALMYGPCFRNATTGMLEVADMGGLDVWVAGEDSILPALDNSDRACEKMRKLVEAGNLGLKTGRGFYEYSDETRDAVQKAFYKRLVTQLKVSEKY